MNPRNTTVSADEMPIPIDLGLMELWKASYQSTHRWVILGLANSMELLIKIGEWFVCPSF